MTATAAACSAARRGRGQVRQHRGPHEPVRERQPGRPRLGAQLDQAVGGQLLEAPVAGCTSRHAANVRAGTPGPSTASASTRSPPGPWQPATWAITSVAYDRGVGSLAGDSAGLDGQLVQQRSVCSGCPRCARPAGPPPRAGTGRP